MFIETICTKDLVFWPQDQWTCEWGKEKEHMLLLILFLVGEHFVFWECTFNSPLDVERLKRPHSLSPGIMHSQAHA